MKPTFSFRRHLLSATFLSLAVSIGSQAGADIWQDVERKSASKLAKNSSLPAQTGALNKARRLNLNMSELTFTLNQAPGEQFGLSNTQLELPLPNGELRQYTIYHSPIMAKGLADQHPNIQTYKIVDSLNSENTGRLDLTPEGFHGIISHGGDTVYIDPIGVSGQYQSYFKSDFAAERAGQNHSPLICTAMNEKSSGTNNQTSFANTKAKFSFGTNLRTYRLAMAATGEFTQFHGGTKESSLAAIVTGVNRVNQIYERDAAIKLELVENTSDVIYTDAAADPFTDNDADALIGEVGEEINAKIGSDNYDIGHVFSTGGGGLAGFGVVCGEDKAEGVTGSPEPVNDPFFIDFVAHEIGHQFAANHTFNSNFSSCEDNREPTAAYEPGSGSTIMGYASLCGEEDIQLQSDAYFHTHSITQISEFISDTSTGGSCGISTSLSNAAPVPNAGQDGHIPKSTPFILTGSATDTNAGDSLSYAWEQYDLGTATNSKAENVDDGSRPLFRSFSPTPSASRTFPQTSDILSGTATFGETLPTTDRDLNFRLTVRDGKGGVAAEDMKLTVSSAAGPFVVTAPAAAVTWTGNSTQTVSWDVANTTAAPINCDTVDITLSQDGGQSFDTIIIAATPNDGSQSVTVPDVTTTTGRISVKCASQPFFAVNSGTVSIEGSTTSPTNNAPTANSDIFTVAQDSSAINFDVLVNDTDADGDTLTVSGISNISNGGTVTANGGQVSYQPADGFSGTETFTYTVSDGNTGSTSAQVTVTVTPTASANNAPVANDDDFTVDQDSGAANLAVLSNDTDADDNTLSIAALGNISNGGTASINGTSISYQPANGFSGTETLTYTVSDGTDTSAAATVTISVTATPAGSTETPTTPITTSSGGGGGSFGLFMLLILGAARKLKTMRLRRFPRKAEG